MALVKLKSATRLYWTLAVAGSCLLLAGLGGWQGLRLLRPETFQRDLQAWLSARTGWSVSYDHMALVPLPQWHLNVNNVSLQVPDTASIRLAALQIYPQLVLLPWGQFRLAKLVAVSPVVRVFQTSAPVQAEAVPQSLVTRNFKERFLPALGRVSGYFLHGLIQIENGSLVLEANNQTQLSWDGIQALISFPRQGLGIQLTARESSHHKPLSFSGRLAYAPGRIEFSRASGTYPPSYFSNLNGHFSWQSTPGLWITSGKLVLGLNALVPLLAELAKTSPGLRELSSQALSLRVSSASLTGSWSNPELQRIEAAGEVENLVFQSGRLPGSVRIQGGSFALRDRAFALRDLRVKLPDSALLISGDLVFPPDALPVGSLNFSGDLGPEFIKKIAVELPLPPKFRLQAPIKISSAKIAWDQKSEVAFNAGLKFPGNLSLNLDGSWSGSRLRLAHLELQDESERAGLTCRLTDQTLDFSFDGKMSGAVYDKVFVEPAPEKMEARGNFRFHAEKNNFKAFSARGDMHAAHLLLPLFLGAPVRLESLECLAREKIIDVRLEDLAWGKTRFSALGVIKPQLNVYSANLTITAKMLDVDALINTITALSDALATSTSAATDALPWQLAFNVASQGAVFNGYRFSPVQASLLVAPQGKAHTVDVLIQAANLGGMTATGKVHIQDAVIALEVLPQARRQDLQKFLDALSAQAPRFSGLVDISGRITGRGKQEDLVDALQGTVDFKATQGRIYNFTFLSQILSVLNVSEILVGTLPGIGKTGVGYSDFSLHGSLQNGKYQFQEAILKADNMDITGKGSIGLARGNLDLVILVAPFKTVNRVVNFLPVVNYLFNHHLVAFPITVKGTLGAPQMNYAALSVDEGIFGILKRTLLLPVYLASPFFPKNPPQTPAAALETMGVSPTAQDQLPAELSRPLKKTK